LEGGESLFKLRLSASFQASLDAFNHAERFSSMSESLAVLERRTNRYANLSLLRETDASAYTASALPRDMLFTRMSSAQRIAYLQRL
jgi:hypothetical protein